MVNGTTEEWISKLIGLMTIVFDGYDSVHWCSVHYTKFSLNKHLSTTEVPMQIFVLLMLTT